MTKRNARKTKAQNVAVESIADNAPQTALALIDAQNVTETLDAIEPQSDDAAQNNAESDAQDEREAFAIECERKRVAFNESVDKRIALDRAEHATSGSEPHVIINKVKDFESYRKTMNNDRVIAFLTACAVDDDFFNTPKRSNTYTLEKIIDNATLFAPSMSAHCVNIFINMVRFAKAGIYATDMNLKAMVSSDYSMNAAKLQHFKRESKDYGATTANSQGSSTRCAFEVFGIVKHGNCDVERARGYMLDLDHGATRSIAKALSVKLD